MVHSDWHPDEAVLLQAADGELAPEVAQAVKDHLCVCPACREQSEQLEHTLGQASTLLLEEHRLQLAAFSEQRNFRERLAALDRAGRRGEPWRRAFLGIRRPHTWRIVALAGAAAACVILFLLFYPQRKLRTVSASDVLVKASGLRTQEQARTAAPAVRQKLRIRVGGQEMTRTILRDIQGRKQWDLWDGARSPAKMAPAAAEALRQRLADSPIDWDDPLSPDRFLHWYGLHANKEHDMVNEESGVISVQTSADSGPVLQASLRLRAADYHPIGESLSFEDQESVEISELEYEVLRDREQLVKIESPASPPSQPQHPQGRDAADDAEMMALSILHDAGADLGGEIQVHSGQNGTVEVSGFAGTGRRKMELVAALARVPGIVIKLKTIEDMPARGHITAVGSGVPSGVTAQTKPVAEALADRIPDPLEREAFAGKALDLSQALLSHAFALSRLGDRYPPQAEGTLAESSKTSLRKMAADHIAIIRQSARELRQQMRTVLGGSVAAEGVPPLSGPWQDGRAALLAAARDVDAALTALFTQDSPSNASTQRMAAISTKIAELETMAGDIEKNIAVGVPNPRE